jgi:hypothetical protein
MASILSAFDIEHFKEKGYVIVRNAFSRETAKTLADIVWQKIKEKPNQPATWNRPAAELQEVIRTREAAALFTNRYRGSIDDLLGANRWHTNKNGFGWIPVRFPGFRSPPWKPPLKGWHIDGINFTHRINSKEVGLAGMEFLSDIPMGGGGTALRVGSHKYIAQLLKSAGEKGLSYMELREISEITKSFPVEEANGNAGDVLWMHPFLIHARSPNVGNLVRIASNRTISLTNDLNLGAENNDPSILEQSIRLALI